MVLEGLGNTLKDTLNKISKAIFVDERLINELIKEIQKALLKGDVNVKLVLQLTDKIKQRALKEEPPGGLTKKEYLTNIVYQELVNFLGEEKAVINIDKKQTRIMLVGLFGNGKCVHKDSNVLLANGQTVTAEKLYNYYKQKKGELNIEDGNIIPLDNELFVPSFNPKTLLIEKKKVTNLWKLNSKDLINVNLDNGNNFNVKTTQEHPFFILRDGAVQQKRADELEKGDHVAIPASIVHESKFNDFKSILNSVDADIIVDSQEANIIKRKIISEYGSLKEALKTLSRSRNYAKFTLNLKKGQVPIAFCNLAGKDKIRIKIRKSLDFVDFPTSLLPEFAEFIGYIIGDGYLSKGSVNMANEDDEIIERMLILSKSLFSVIPTITKDKRTKKLVNIRLNSITLVELISKLFKIPIGKKGRFLEIPALIQTASSDATASFIQAYFDCDGYFSPKERQIEVTSESRILLQQLHHLLLRFNIVGVHGKKSINGKEYYRLNVQGRHTVNFFENISIRIERKKRALEKYEIITLKQGDGKHDLIPAGDILKRFREAKGYSIGQIQKYVSSYGLYEKKGIISRTQLRKMLAVYDTKEKGNFSQLIGLIKNQEVSKLQEKTNISQPLLNSLIGEFKKNGMIAEVTNSPTKLVLTQKGKGYCDRLKGDEFNLIKTLKCLAYSNVSWIPVKSLSKIKNDSNYVYDLTVEDNHSFIADGIIVHNTTSAGKLAKYFKKRGHKIALISLDVWRPAAFEQLKQVGERAEVAVFGNPKQKDPAKILKEFDKDLAKFDLVIYDTAGRDALNDELITELKLINKLVNPNEVLLVMGADVGQAAEKQAQTFHDTCNVTGVIITKLDGTAKGGGALSACAITGAKVKFIGIGEKIDAFEEFDPKRFVGRLLGMGDLEALLEKAKDAISEEEATDLSKKLLKGEFTLVDLYSQMEAMSKMGPLGKVMEMIPGFGQLKIPKEALQGQEEKLKKWKHIMNSMTKIELEDPEEIDGKRAERIAKGAGVPVSDVRDLIKQYKQSKKLVKMMKGGKGMEQMMKKMGEMKK